MGFGFFFFGGVGGWNVTRSSCLPQCKGLQAESNVIMLSIIKDQTWSHCWHQLEKKKPTTNLERANLIFRVYGVSFHLKKIQQAQFSISTLVDNDLSNLSNLDQSWLNLRFYTYMRWDNIYSRHGSTKKPNIIPNWCGQA